MNDLSMPEQEFTSRLQAQDKQAFELLYDRYSGALYNIVLRICGDESVAGDVLQSSFLKIWKNLPSYDTSKGTLFTWMLNIARNTAIDVQRRKKGQPDIQELNPSVSSTMQSQVHMMNTDVIDIKNKVEELKPEYREAIDAVYFYGLTHEEAAQRLGLPLGTLKTRVRQALGILRQLFE